MSNKTIATIVIINALVAKREEIENEWLANDGGLTWAATSAIGCINGWIKDISVYDRVSQAYIWDMQDVLRQNYVNLQF